MSDKKNEDYVAVRMSSLDAPGRNPLRGYNGSGAPAARRSRALEISNSPGFSILSYCLASISMTVVNKYLVSGTYWNMNFLYLAIQVSLSRTTPFCLLFCLLSLVCCCVTNKKFVLFSSSLLSVLSRFAFCR